MALRDKNAGNPLLDTVVSAEDGFRSCSNEQLVQEILGTRIRLSDDGLSLQRMAVMTSRELEETLGVTRNQALTLKAVIELGGRLASIALVRGRTLSTPQEVARFVSGIVQNDRTESFYVITLTQKHEPIDCHRISTGSLFSTPVHPREVFKVAIGDSAAAIVAFHNHPTGNVSPSADDKALTIHLAEAGNLLGIRLLDHLVIGRDGDHTSLKYLIPEKDRESFRIPEERASGAAFKVYEERAPEGRTFAPYLPGVRDGGRRYVAEITLNLEVKTGGGSPHQETSDGYLIPHGWRAMQGDHAEHSRSAIHRTERTLPRTLDGRNGSLTPKVSGSEKRPPGKPMSNESIKNRISGKGSEGDRFRDEDRGR